MGEYKKARIMFTCQHEIRKGLQEWADSENRTLSNLMELLSEKALEERRRQSVNPGVDNKQKPG